ncbi:hypothetical protein AAC387_Pa07g0595 [Persea americana]
MGGPHMLLLALVCGTHSRFSTSDLLKKPRRWEGKAKQSIFSNSTPLSSPSRRRGLGASPSQSCDLSGYFSAIRNGFMIGTLLWEGPIREGEEERGSPSSNDVSLQLGEQKSM